MTTLTIEDSEDKIIQRLGNCDKVPVDYMDLLSHRVRCRKIEIFHYEDEVSFTPNEEEEEQGISLDGQYSDDRTDDEDRTMKLVGELDCLVRRIEQMQLVIKQRREDRLDQFISDASTDASTTSVTPEPQLGVFEFKRCRPVKQKRELSPHEEQLAERPLPIEGIQKDPLSCDEKVEVRDLQHAHHQLQCEIDEVICRYNKMRTLLCRMRDQVCQENGRLRKLSEIANKYQEWSELVAKEMHVCKERYTRLLDGKLSKSQAKSIISAHRAKIARFNKTFLTKRQLNYEVKEFHLEIDELKEYAKDMRHELMRRFATVRLQAGQPGDHCTLKRI